MTLKEIVEQLRMCGYVCEAGPLENNTAFIELVKMAEAVRNDKTAIERYEDKIEDIIAEFGDQPEQCLSIIGEHINLTRHYRNNPKASRLDEWA